MEVRERLRTRLYFITTPDIRNIASKCRIEPRRLHNMDTESIQMRVDANPQSDGIQFYSRTQREWLQKYGQRALCVDDTFNLTSYSLRLATVIVADEWDRALLAAYLPSYRMTEVAVSIVFEHVKKLLPSFRTDYFMTDGTNTFWNGFNKQIIAPFEPFLKKIREICLARNRNKFVAKYTSMLKCLRENEETVLAS
ncbi:hypothetical protein RB195_022901 [Necator americanus]|uniref:MULE transposase domain-containing protein n=1 Tax=Necator americanus TaxID=51031 RepID=A0ABR1EH11_NECAM